MIAPQRGTSNSVDDNVALRAPEVVHGEAGLQTAQSPTRVEQSGSLMKDKIFLTIFVGQLVVVSLVRVLSWCWCHGCVVMLVVASDGHRGWLGVATQHLAFQRVRAGGNDWRVDRDVHHWCLDGALCTGLGVHGSRAHTRGGTCTHVL